MAKLEGKIALIALSTGGVSEGIVRAFLQEGATVVVPSRTQEKLQELRGYLGATTERFIPIVGDMSDSDRLENCVDRILNQVGQMDGICSRFTQRSLKRRHPAGKDFFTRTTSRRTSRMAEC